ncbi:MAG: EFR1 family ferrodoxin [Candidatus Fimenecus sp.]
MIFYFSGTGNSRFAAETVGKALSETPISVNALLQKQNRAAGGEYVSETPFVFVSPTYAWRISRVMENFIRENTFSGCRNAYFLMTCGDSIGAAAQYLQALCTEKGLQFCGVQKIVMPENYIAMFSAPEKTEAQKIIENAVPVLNTAAEAVRAKKDFPPQKISAFDRVYSGPVNALFYKLFVSAKGFYATDACVSCEQCVRICPLNNIKLQNGKPVWGADCTHCMACICHCPKEAIEYKTKSKGQPRYTAEKALQNIK